MPCQTLNDRAVLSIDGSDATAFLQGLVTANVYSLEPETLAPCALLTPQGKIAFDFLIGKTDNNGFFLDIRKDLIADCLKKLSLYKLRADIHIETLEDWQPTVLWHEDVYPGACYKDLRFPDGVDIYINYDFNTKNIAQGDFRKIRIENAVAESGADFEPNDIFPHDIYFDLNGAIDFKKGCYLGQEVVSRMQHRATIRRRTVLVHADHDLEPTGTDLKADNRTIGKLGTVLAHSGLAIIRLDRFFDAQQKKINITSGEVNVTITFPVQFSNLMPPPSSDVR